MFQCPPRERAWVSWLAVAAWTAVIFFTIPFARRLQEWVTARWGREMFSVFVLSVILVLSAGAIVQVLRAARGGVSWSRILWLAGVAALTLYSTRRFNQSPEETLHFLEYGFLSLLAFRAVAHRTRDAGAYIAAALVTAVIGAADETVQWMVPRRYFDFRDIVLNAYSGVLFQVALARGIVPPFIRRGIAAASWDRICRLALGLLLVLGFCASNTPALLETYTRWIPPLRFLRANTEVMAEYGYRHEDPAIGVFFSRLTREELKAEDRRRAAEAAAILDEYHAPKRYEEFCTVYGPGRDPFLHEARVHLFRRDHYRAVAPKHAKVEKDYRYHITVAFRENQIVESYFGETLKRSRYVYEPELIAELERKMDPDLAYESGVSNGLFTRFRERELWLGIGAAAVVLVALCRYGKKRARRAGPSEENPA